jgi:two-component system, CitB family, response regulator
MKPIRTLIVEDDPRISELHRRFVDKIDDFELVGVANTLPDAREMIDVLQPDLVLLDLFFPEGNGLELLRRIRGGATPCDVILITAAREMGSLQEALRGGVFDYIIKPVFFPRLQEALQKFHNYFRAMASGGTLEQRDIDRLLHSAQAVQGDVLTTPKGIDPLTLKKVRQVFTAENAGNFSAEEIGEQIGVSRSTARRYLEFLVSDGLLGADLIYGVVGRPERRYFRLGS